MIQEVFPSADVTWTRKDPRVPQPRLIVSTSTGVEVANIAQFDMSDEFRGPGVEEVAQRLKLFKSSI